VTFDGHFEPRHPFVLPPAADDGTVTQPSRSLDRLITALAAHDPSHLEAAWRGFVADHTRLLLHVARSVFKSHDEVMDAYAFVLDQLRANDCRRLREFANDPRSRVSTWLVVVSRRLCLDFYRRRYGRDHGGESRDQRAIRRRLQDLVAEDVDVHELPATHAVGAELLLRQAELRSALDRALEDVGISDRLLLRLRFDDGLSAQEIARLLGFSSAFHVYRRVNALLARLRRALEAQGIESALP
jgi:RNA polymerase sigma factor (sigma-70 family)